MSCVGMVRSSTHYGVVGGGREGKTKYWEREEAGGRPSAWRWELAAMRRRCHMHACVLRRRALAIVPNAGTGAASHHTSVREVRGALRVPLPYIRTGHRRRQRADRRAGPHPGQHHHTGRGAHPRKRGEGAGQHEHRDAALCAMHLVVAHLHCYMGKHACTTPNLSCVSLAAGGSSVCATHTGTCCGYSSPNLPDVPWGAARYVVCRHGCVMLRPLSFR